MKTIDIKNINGVNFNGGISYRSVLLKNNMGFAMMKTCINKGGPYLWHYKNHKEACYCVTGNGFVKDLDTGEISNIYPGITYLVDNNQKHEFTAITDVVLISVFNPPLRGDETHDQFGNYI
jgi:L-ectoine synthase